MRHYIVLNENIIHQGKFLHRVRKRLFNYQGQHFSKPLTEDIDFILRFERLEEDFRELCAILNIPYEPLPHVNSSRKRHYSHYYDDELKELVRNKFREEIELFNYRFERVHSPRLRRHRDIKRRPISKSDQ